MPAPLGAPVRIVIHHTAAPASLSVQRINEIHRGRFGGIGYHAYIHQAAGDDWIISDGRDDGNRGAHVAGANTGSLGVAIGGDYSDHPPPPGALGMVVGQCVAWCLQYGISPSAIHAHRDTPGGTTATVCPGMTPIGAIRRAVSAALSTLPNRP